MPEKLTPEEVSIAAQAVGCPVADVHASAPIRLYKCPQSQREWKYTGHCGIATVQFDTTINVVYIRVTDLRTKTVVFEQEGYEGLIFEKQSPFFYTVESDDHIAGFCFAEDFDAAAFALKVTGLMNISKQAAMVSQGAKKSPASGGAAPKSPTSKAPEHQKSQSGGSSGGGISGLISGIFKGKNTAPAPAAKKPVIGKVKSFKHVAHLGFSATEGFGEIPPEWRKIFNQAGLSDEDLKDKKTAAFVMKTIVAATSDAPPPPPPPPISGSAPSGRPAPPAPPTATRGAPPPPPPPVSNLSPSAPAPPPPPPVASAGSGSQDLMSMIKSTKLKKVTESDIPKVEEMDESQQTDLAKKIAMAMEMRRSHMQDSDDEEDDDWEM